MPQVSVTINGHAYAVACEAGEEHRIRELARRLDEKVALFAGDNARAGEARLLVLGALVLADELADANETLARLAQDGAAEGGNAALAEGIDRLARRIEAVASRLEISHI